MKGIVLAGGRGTRLRPFTYIIKKELLPVYDKPLIFYPLDTLRRSGVSEAVVVVDPKGVGPLADILGDGKELGMKITYAIQNEPLGMAHALLQARYLVGEEEPIMVIAGDNLFEEDFKKEVERFREGALVAITKVPDPRPYGVVSFRGDQIVRIEEKPLKPASQWIQTSMFLFDGGVFKIGEELTPSQRGEYEITSISNVYIRMKKLSYVKAKKAWFDAGTFENLLQASLFVARQRQREAKSSNGS